MATEDPETWMWERARAMLERAERIQKSFFAPGRPGSPRPAWQPPVDVFETRAEVRVLAALPGVEAQRVRVELRGNRIRIEGERRLPGSLRNAVVHRLEIPHGRFERAVELPPGSYEIAHSQLAEGCLFIHLRKIDTP